MTIKIRIFDTQNVCNINIFGDENLIEYNGLEKNMKTDSIIDNFVDIFSIWENEESQINYVSDCENFSVEVCDNGVCKKFFGQGNYPKNYAEFKNLTKEIVKCF